MNLDLLTLIKLCSFGYAPSLLTEHKQMRRRLLPFIMETSRWWRPTGNKTGINTLCGHGKQAVHELAYTYEVCR